MREPAKDEATLERVVADSIQDWIGHVDDIYPQACKTLAAIRAAGWAVVPAEPTEEIQDAIIHAMDDAGYITANQYEAADIYRAAMLAAAPGVEP